MIIIGCLTMGAVLPNGEIIDSHRYEQAETHVTRRGVVVTAVSGLAQWRAGPEQRWVAVRVGAEIDGPAEFRTGPRSNVTLTIPSGETISIDRLGQIRLADLVGPDGKVIQKLEPKFDPRRKEADPLEHETVIHSPGKVLAVRG